jgi:bifunctional UDP-N-acetylglucosamine pyrophosphorylase / glucosamine-1-phosphate N-acetyltransferase
MNNNTISEIQNKREMLKIKACELIKSGVLVHDPERLDIRGDLTCGKDVEIDINVIVEGKVILGDGVSIGANSFLINCEIGNGTKIKPFSFIENSLIGKNSFVGPYARIRPGTLISDNVQIGNFVEIKNSKIDSKCRINHLSFIGDTDMEDNVTIGAGTVTCNHNGVNTNRTIMRKGAYIGSGSNLVAPLIVNYNSTIGAGSTITENTPSNLLTIARSKQKVVKNWKRPKKLEND